MKSLRALWARFKKLTIVGKATVLSAVFAVLVPVVQYLLAPALPPRSSLSSSESTTIHSGDGQQINLGRSQIHNSHVTINQSLDPKADRKQKPPLSFQQIEIDEKLSQWSAIQRPYTRNGWDTKLDGSPLPQNWPAFGPRLRTWPMGAHQIPHYVLDDNTPDRSIDPVFSVVLTNVSDEPTTISAIGIVPVASWTAIKAEPIFAKLTNFDAISITMRGFNLDEPQIHKFAAPVYLQPHKPYPVKIRLVGYNKAVKHNESAIKFRAVANQQNIDSDNLYLGLCVVQE